MNKQLMILAATATLAACHTPTEPTTPKIGMANPASTFCVEQGGRLELVKDANGGAVGMCHLPDGRVVEEWAWFRSQHKGA